MSERSGLPKASGHCHCGAVAYDIYGPMRQVVECHCESCRRLTGGLWHATGAKQTDVDVHDVAGALSWYRSSEHVERGFCGKCGSSLFFRRDGAGHLTITAGTLNRPSGLKLGVRIFTGETADYGDWSSDVPTFEDWPPRDFFNIPEE